MQFNPAQYSVQGLCRPVKETTSTKRQKSPKERIRLEILQMNNVFSRKKAVFLALCYPQESFRLLEPEKVDVTCEVPFGSDISRKLPIGPISSEVKIFQSTHLGIWEVLIYL